MQNNIINNKIIKNIVPFKMVNVKIKDVRHRSLFRANCVQAYIDFCNDFIYNKSDEKSLTFYEMCSNINNDFLYNKGDERSFAKTDSAFGEIYRYFKMEYIRIGDEERAESVTNSLLKMIYMAIQYCRFIEANQINEFPIPNLEYFDLIKNYMMKYKDVINDLEVTKMRYKYAQDFCNGITDLSIAAQNSVFKNRPFATQ